MHARCSAATSTRRCGSSRSGSTELEADCDRYLERLEKLRSFILPGGTPGAAYLHVALHRGPPRRALGLGGRRGLRHRARRVRGHGGVNPVTATYLNRLSDLLFVLARCANLPGGDVLWQPGGGREQLEAPRQRLAPLAIDSCEVPTVRVTAPRSRAQVASRYGQHVGRTAQATLTLKPGGLDSSQARTAV